MYINRNKNSSIRVHVAQQGRCYSVFPESLVIVLSWILLRRILQNFACSTLTLKDDIDINFASVACQGALQSQLFQNFCKNADLVFYWMKSHKNLHARHELLEITFIYFSCIELNNVHQYSVFSKILVIIVSRLLLNGILKFFI